MSKNEYALEHMCWMAKKTFSLADRPSHRQMKPSSGSLWLDAARDRTILKNKTPRKLSKVWRKKRRVSSYTQTKQPNFVYTHLHNCTFIVAITSLTFACRQNFKNKTDNIFEIPFFLSSHVRVYSYTSGAHIWRKNFPDYNMHRWR